MKPSRKRTPAASAKASDRFLDAIFSPCHGQGWRRLRRFYTWTLVALCILCMCIVWPWTSEE